MFSFFGIPRRWIADRRPTPTEVVPPFHFEARPAFYEDERAYMTQTFRLRKVEIGGGKWNFQNVPTVEKFDAMTTENGWKFTLTGCSVMK